MAPTPKTLIVGNWKMNGLQASSGEIDALRQSLGDLGKTEVGICPPATLIMALVEKARGTSLMIGGQDCHMGQTGAHTGDISAQMLKDAGAALVIVGHSERRGDHNETDEQVAAKAKAAQAAGLKVIVCVGESLEDREAGRAVAHVTGQIRRSVEADLSPAALVLAYEPIWAIGTGKVAGIGDIEEMHAAVRNTLKDIFGAAGDQVQILYGGSVKPQNAGEILAAQNVNGALVGGASLKAADFGAIIEAS